MYYLTENESPFLITVDSVPVLDGWGWADYWGVGDWIEWHKLLRKKYGKDVANKTLLNWYHKASFGASSYDWRSFDTRFKNYAKLSGFYDGLFAGIGIIAKPISVSSTIVDSTGKVVENVAKGAERGSKTLSWLIPVGIGVVVIGLGYVGYKKYVK